MWIWIYLKIKSLFKKKEEIKSPVGTFGGQQGTNSFSWKVVINGRGEPHFNTFFPILTVTLNTLSRWVNASLRVISTNKWKKLEYYHFAILKKSILGIQYQWLLTSSSKQTWYASWIKKTSSVALTKWQDWV